jgi:hypothetical protein
VKGKKRLIKVKVSSSKYQMSVLHKKGENVLEADTISEAVCFSSKKNSRKLIKEKISMKRKSNTKF